MMAFLVELGPVRRGAASASAVARQVARTFSPRRGDARTPADEAALAALARRRLGIVRLGGDAPADRPE